MRTILAILIMTVASFAPALAQNETAPLVDSSIEYENWHLKNVFDDGKTKLRDFISDKKLVLVVYFAAWCHNWRHEAPFIQKMHDKYKDQGLGVIGVAEFETVERTRTNLNELKIMFPVVYESDALSARTETKFYKYRTAVGDTRKWGSPWHIFIETASMEKKGDVIVRRAYTVSGEVQEGPVEAFIREKLGLAPEATPMGK